MPHFPSGTVYKTMTLTAFGQTSQIEPDMMPEAAEPSTQLKTKSSKSQWVADWLPTAPPPPHASKGGPLLLRQRPANDTERRAAYKAPPQLQAGQGGRSRYSDRRAQAAVQVMVSATRSPDSASPTLPMAVAARFGVRGVGRPGTHPLPASHHALLATHRQCCWPSRN